MPRIPSPPILLAGSALAASALLPWQLAWLCALAAIIVLGVPHGALDGEIARPLLRLRFGRLWFAVFSLPYLALFALVLLAWRLVPMPTLAAFLAISVWHFGEDPTGGASVTETLFRGGLPIALPVLAHPQATAFIFGTVAQVALPAPPPWLLLASFCWLGIAVVVGGQAMARRRSRQLIQPGALIAMFLLLPPLTAFAIYFVCVHAPSHMAALVRDPSRAPRVGSARAAWLRAVPLCGLTLLIGIALWPLYHGALPLRLLSLTIQTLAALTVPHMLLNGWLDWSAAARPRRMAVSATQLARLNAAAGRRGGAG